jgi:hypothetical protein
LFLLISKMIIAFVEEFEKVIFSRIINSQVLFIKSLIKQGCDNTLHLQKNTHLL